MMTAIAIDIAKNPKGLDFSDPEPDTRPDRPQLGPKVRTGIIPSPNNDEGGVLISRVAEGTSAEDAGLEPGDIIVRWSGQDVEDVQTWMPTLLELEPGDEIELTVDRDGERIDLIMILREP